MVEAGRQPRMPEAPCPYLLEYLLEVGPVEQGGFGPKRLTHQELRAWQHNMGRKLQPWELAMLVRLSEEWLASAMAAEAPDAPAPWAGDAPTADEKRKIAANLRERLSGMAKP